MITDLRVIRSRNFFFRVHRRTKSPLHVRLARANPHLADQHVVEGDLVVAGHHQAGGLAVGLKRVELHHPLAIVARLGGLGLAGEGDRDFFARVSPTPDGHGQVALQDHAATKNRRQSDIGRGCKGNRQEG